MPRAPLLQVVDWADTETVVGVTPEGTVAVSNDSGATWTTRPGVDSVPQAVGAHMAADGSIRVLVVTTTAVMASTDRGATFAPVDGA